MFFSLKKPSLVDECFNSSSRPETMKDTCTSFENDKANVLLKMEISGTLNVKYMKLFDGFLIASKFSTIQRKKHE